MIINILELKWLYLNINRPISCSSHVLMIWMSYLHQYIVKRYKAKQIILLLRNRKKTKHLFGTALLTKKIHCLKKIRIWHLGLPPPSTFMSRCQSIWAPRTKSLSNLLACNSVSSSVEPSFTHFGCMRNKFSLRENFYFWHRCLIVLLISIIPKQ